MLCSEDVGRLIIIDFITAWSRNLIATYVNTHRLNTPPHREAGERGRGGREDWEGGLKYEAESRIGYLCRVEVS